MSKSMITIVLAITNCAVMLNEAKISRPRPGPWGRGRDQGQSFEVKAKAEANFLTSRPGRGQR